MIRNSKRNSRAWQRLWGAFWLHDQQPAMFSIFFFFFGSFLYWSHMTCTAFTSLFNPFQSNRFHSQSVCRRSHLPPPPPTLSFLFHVFTLCRSLRSQSPRFPLWLTAGRHLTTTPLPLSCSVSFCRLLPFFSFDGLCLAAVDVGLPRDASIPPPRKPKRRSSIQMKCGVCARVRVAYLCIRQLHSENVNAKLRIKFNLCYY